IGKDAVYFTRADIDKPEPDTKDKPEEKKEGIAGIGDDALCDDARLVASLTDEKSNSYKVISELLSRFKQQQSLLSEQAEIILQQKELARQQGIFLQKFAADIQDKNALIEQQGKENKSLKDRIDKLNDEISENMELGAGL